MKKIFLALCVMFFGFIQCYAQDTTPVQTNDENIQNAVDWKPYIAELEKNIKSNWNPPKADVSNSIKVSFKLSKDGSLIKYDIKQSSGKKSADDAAVSAVKSAMPFKPFPANATTDSIDIEFRFDYNILAQKRAKNTVLPDVKTVDTVQSPKWVNVADIKDPIRLLDTENIYRLNYKNTEGTVFRFRYLSKNKTEQVATFFADFGNEKIGVISIKPYDGETAPNFAITDELNMKNISEFKTNFTKIKAYADKNNLQNCPKEYLTPPLTEQEKVLLKRYIKEVGAKIKKNWVMPKIQKEAYAVVNLKINKKGEIEHCEITQSSKNEMFNETVLQTVKTSGPFDTFPKGYEKEFIQIDYSFGYNTKNPKTGDTYERLYKVNTAANVLGTLLLIPLMILGID